MIFHNITDDEEQCTIEKVPQHLIAITEIILPHGSDRNAMVR